MDEFGRLLAQSGEQERNERAERWREMADKSRRFVERLERQQAVFGKKPGGTDPRIVLGEKASLVTSFMETMQVAGYPGAAKIVKEYVIPRHRSSLLSLLMDRTPKPVHLDAYAIGEAGRKTIYICDDLRLRYEDGESLESEEFNPGAFVTRAQETTSYEHRGTYPTSETVFCQMPIEDALLHIAGTNLKEK